MLELKPKEWTWPDRNFRWADQNDHCAILYGPEPYEVAAIVELVPGTDETENGEWRVMSGTYGPLNMIERDVGVSLADMKRRVTITLGSAILAQKKLLEEDHGNVLKILYEGEEEDPYAWT